MSKFNEISKKYLESLSREELKSLLLEAGFEVEDGVGEVIFTESLEAECHFTIKGHIELTNDYSYQPTQESFSYPFAC
ncbi:hypothetical protein [Cytobacillus firmus]|uniref:hypothetical protein n=1 Tax=Cytobacillus firmus TaxID=1399 RepID=UPI0018CD3409|nr:hypothetical protein [Cytobacillus firmus]MBG9656281.1 hypothetical protein [Cytobacillus firmus]MED1904563.1 hypothetical protein [Cytobacillus firmus]